jgi:hypothetical protein
MSETLANGASPSAPRLPPPYSSLAPVAPELHRDLRVRPTGYGFAAKLMAVPLGLDEFPLAARQLPVVFSSEAPHLPLALLGITGQQNEFVDAQGRWREGVYIPAYLRRFPFLLVRVSPQSEELALCLDPGAPQFSTEEGEPLFDAEGKLSALGNQALEFCRAVEVSFARARAFAEGLVMLGLLAPSAVQFEQGGQKTRLDGFHAVQREAFMKLSGEQLVLLRDKGWLEPLHAHLFSVAAVPALVHQKAA